MPTLDRKICGGCTHGLEFTEHRTIVTPGMDSILRTSVVCLRSLTPSAITGYSTGQCGARTLGDPVPDDCPYMLELILKEAVNEKPMPK